MATMRHPREATGLWPVLLGGLMLSMITAGQASALYPPDGSKPDGPGAYRNPDDGMCVIGVAADGTLLVDWSITTSRDCVAYTKSADGSVDLVGLNTQDKCTKAGFAGNDGYKHAWSTSLCYDVANQKGISRVDLDNTDAMCFSKGGTIVTTGKCVAFGWQYRNRKDDGTLPVSGTGIGTTDGVQFSDGLGFCYASMRMTSGTYNSAATCPSFHNSQTTAPAEWPPCASSATGCQTQASYDAGLGWSFASPQCLYQYGAKGVLNAAATKADGTTYAAGSTQDLTLYTNQGDCLANGFSWDNWLPNSSTTVETTSVDYPGIPAGSFITRLDALSSVEDGGGDFYSGTGAVCLKCHSDQSRSYQERNKPGFVKTPHKLAGDAIGEPFQPNFTEAGSDWGLQGVQCSMCHSTAKPAQDDLIQVQPAGTPNAGAPKSASGHNNTEYGTHLVDICYTCHGTATVPVSGNPAAVIPASGGELELTAKGLEPITNEFLNSPHAKYTGTSSKVDVGNKDNYGSTFHGYVCRTGAGKLSSSTYPNSGACTGAGYTWYTTTSNGSFCYYSLASCVALPQTGQWFTTFDPAVYPWAADTGGPGGVCAGIGIGSIVTTVYRDGEAEKIHNLDSTTNEACSNVADGSSDSGASAFWVKDGEASPGGIPADTAQGTCMTCHDVHWAMDDENPEAEPFRRECTTCHSNAGTSASGAPQIDLSTINHLATAGTPLENAQTNPEEACVTCHMPASGDEDSSPLHLWRINTDPGYETIGSPAVNLDGEGQAWVDLDHACGQCHGGGSAQDAEHTATPPALYRTRAQLATVAEGMHDSAGVSYPVTFTTKMTGMKVDVVAYVNCGVGIPCPAFTYDWNWGDGSANDVASPSTDHTYGSFGTKQITLTVLLDGKIVGKVSRNVTPTGTDSAPVASASCAWNANTWTVTVTDTSTDGDPTPVQNVKIDWGDDTSRGVGGAGSVQTHTYRYAGSYSIEFTAIDSALKSSTTTLVCSPGPVAPAPFTISGTGLQSDGTTPVEAANVVVKQGRVRLMRVKTAADGTFSAGSLIPGTYKLKVRKSGFTFAIPAATRTVGPSSGGNTILAITP